MSLDPNKRSEGQREFDKVFEKFINNKKTYIPEKEFDRLIDNFKKRIEDKKNA